MAAAGLLIPEGMAYAGIAGVPPQVGLYAAMLGMFVYAVFGTSRQLAVTSTSSSAAMLAALVAPIALSDSGREDSYRITSLYVHGNLNYHLCGLGSLAGSAGRKLPLEQTGQVFRGEVLRRVGWQFFS
jgi:MFS superfamily sulfate permease-like transporter